MRTEGRLVIGTIPIAASAAINRAGLVVFGGSAAIAVAALASALAILRAG